MKTSYRLLVLAAGAWTAAQSPTAQAFWVDGEGHYALRGATETAPGFSKQTGTYQAIEQSFRLLGEARASDNLSMFLELRLFEDPRRAYLGDQAEPSSAIDCDRNVDRNPGDTGDISGEALPCRHQNSGEPGYKPYTPRISAAYVRYAFDYCLLEAGRRPRDWGLGIFMDGGADPFEYRQSVYDGVTCNVNIQKSQTLGFSFGYDKLQETGAHVYVDPDQHFERRFGATDAADDLDQFFFTIEYDDRRANAGAAFTKQIGVYFAQINGASLAKGGSNTDLKFLDLYTGFFFTDLAIRNEILFRMGKSADPHWQLLGGAALSEGSPATNRLQSIGFAGDVQWTVSRSGAAIGPTDYNAGDASRHVLFLSYAYAPGDEHGYMNDGYAATVPENEPRRDTTASAMAFHPNYKPALILFNQRAEVDGRLHVDGAFSGSRVVNATLFGTGYRYESQRAGNFELKLVTANMNQTAPAPVKAYYAQLQENAGATGDFQAPPGLYGRSLGYELDLSYSYRIGREAELGVAAAAATPGDAWKVRENQKAVNNFLFQGYAAFRF